MKKKVLFVVNVDWFFLSHRLLLAQEALSRGFEVHIATEITESSVRLEGFGFKVHPVKLNRSNLDLIGLFIYFIKLMKVFKSISPDLVHLVTIKPVLIGGLAARISKIPSVLYAISGLGSVFIARDLFSRFLRIFISSLYRISLNHNHSVVVLQNKSDQKLISSIAKIPCERTVIIKGSGVDLSLFKFSNIPSDRSIVMFPARLLKDKGIYEFIAAAKTISSKYKSNELSPRFILVGKIDSQNKTSVKDYEVKNWVDEDIVEYWGFKDEMHTVLPKASLVVLPSYREGLPKVLLEAAACGRPIITTDVPGCRDAIVEESTGIIIPARNYLELIHAIERLFLDHKLQDNFGLAGRRLAEENFDVDLIIKDHFRVYSSLLDK